MIVLGIETATALCSAGLAGEDGLIAEHRLIRKNSHAEVLSDLVDGVCRSAKIPLKKVEGVAVSIGPGSFTGLRIGLSYAKGLVFGFDIPFIGVPTLEAILRPVPPVCSHACVLLTARKGEAYRGSFHWKADQWTAYREDDVVGEADLVKGFPKDEALLFIGSGTEQFRDVLSRNSGAVFLKTDLNYPSGYSVAVLGRERMLAGERTDPDSAVPRYLKRFQGVV